MTGSDSARARLARFVERWELRQRLLLPVLSSLTTAAIVFAAAAIFAPVIRRMFSQPGVSGFPLYCVVEPYNGPRGDTVLVDLYVVNLSSQEQTEDGLRGLVARQGAGRDLSPSLIAQADHPFVDSIVRIDVDSAFNAGKGEVVVARRTPKTYEFSVRRIDPAAIMRFTLVTNMVLSVSSRSNRASNPVRCEWPYRFPAS